MHPPHQPTISDTPRQKHPRGIYTLFFTEMWERMSYYGMRALLILYMVAAVEKGGMGLSETTASAIYGLYVCAVYLVALPGGWIADRLFGPRRAVLAGGIIIALGHFTLAIQSQFSFFAGLLLVVLGTALLKPSASTLVGMLYPEGGARRDAGFTLFYMGVNLGAFFGPIVCGYLGERVNWHYGFGAAGVGMVAGVVQYALTNRSLGDAGIHPASPSPTPLRHWGWVAGGVVALVGFASLAMAGVIPVDPVVLAHRAGMVIAGIAVAWFAWTWFFAGLTKEEEKHLVMIAVLVIASAIFWSGFEQAGSSMNLFGKRYTELHIGSWEMPAGWLLTVNAIMVMAFAPVFSWMWVALAKRGRLPSVVAKFATGLFFLGLGFVVMHFAADRALTHGKVLPVWLISTYLLHTWGELALSPVGLSAMTKLAPPRLGAQVLGIWYLSSSLGNLIAGLFGGMMSSDNVGTMPTLFLEVAAFAGGVALLLAVAAPFLKRLIRGIE